MKQIYIKTDMTEMPKGCKECREKGLSVFGIKNEWTIADAHCFYRETSTTGGSSRPLWCPLVEYIVDDNKTIGEEK